MKDERILILGATSAMAECVARIYASRKASLILVARNGEKLASLSDDLSARGAGKVEIVEADLGDLESLPPLMERLLSSDNEISTVLIAHGVLPEQEAIQDDPIGTQQSLAINFTSPLVLSQLAAQYFISRGKGTLAVITSVAGDRARQSNYIYGTAKGALSLFLQGLRNRVGKTPVRIIDIRPGFVDTPMTAHIKKGPLFASPESVAQGIVRAIDKGQDIVYLPWFWRWVLFIIRSIPECIFKRLSL